MPQKRISQKKLGRFQKLRRKLTELQADIDILEDELKDALRAGATVQAGILRAELVQYEKRNVAWKQVVVREKGQEYADRVLAGTKPDQYEKLVVELV